MVEFGCGCAKSGSLVAVLVLPPFSLSGKRIRCRRVVQDQRVRAPPVETSGVCRGSGIGDVINVFIENTGRRDSVQRLPTIANWTSVYLLVGCFMMVV